MDFFLADTLASEALADVVQLGGRWNQRQDLAPDELVVQNNVSRLQKLQRFQGQQLRISRPGSHQIDLARHDFAPSLVCWKLFCSRLIPADCVRSKASRLASSCSTRRRSSGFIPLAKSCC